MCVIAVVSGGYLLLSTLFVFAPLLSYFIITPKLSKNFALMRPDFESNLITLIFRNFEVRRTTVSDVNFAFVRGT